MLLNLLPILFLSLAAMFKAVSDTLRDHYDTSIFRWKDPKFWKPDISWRYVGYIKFTKFHPDAWHLSNSLMIGAFILIAIFHNMSNFHLHWSLEILVALIWYNLVFNLFYNKILRK